MDGIKLIAVFAVGTAVGIAAGIVMFDALNRLFGAWLWLWVMG